MPKFGGIPLGAPVIRSDNDPYVASRLGGGGAVILKPMPLTDDEFQPVGWAGRIFACVVCLIVSGTIFLSAFGIIKPNANSDPPEVWVGVVLGTLFGLCGLAALFGVFQNVRK